MMRSRKNDDSINAEIGQICMNIDHDHYKLSEILHFLISQREALVGMCRNQQELITLLEKDAKPTHKDTKTVSRETAKLASLLENI